MRLPLLLLGLSVPIVPEASVESVPEPAAVSVHEYRVHVGRAAKITEERDLDDPVVSTARTTMWALWSKGNIPTVEDVERALVDTFGDASYDGSTIEYIWVINPETGHWERVCLGTLSFTVLGRTDPNPVVVTVIDRVQLSAP